MDETEAAVERVMAMLTDTQTRPLAEFEAAIRRELRAARIRALTACFHDGQCTNYSPEKTNELCNRCRLLAEAQQEVEA